MRESPTPGCSRTSGGPSPPLSSAHTLPPSTAIITSVTNGDYRIPHQPCHPGFAGRATPRSFAVCALGNRRRVVTISGMVTVAEPVPLLLERDAELARLSALLKQAHAASGAVVTISGPAGIGKTQLLAAVHRLAGHRGFRSLHARGREL